MCAPGGGDSAGAKLLGKLITQLGIQCFAIEEDTQYMSMRREDIHCTQPPAEPKAKKYARKARAPAVLTYQEGVGSEGLGYSNQVIAKRP